MRFDAELMTSTPKYRARCAVVFYEWDASEIFRGELPSHLLSLHEVLPPKNQRRADLGPAVFLSRRDAAELGARFLEVAKGSDRLLLLPADLLHHDEDSATWWLPAARRPMRHWAGSQRAELATLDVWWPSLVARATCTSFRLVALASSERPELATPVFHAPLPNVYASTELCRGEAALPAEEPLRAIPEWNRILFETAFTHVNHPRTLAGPNTPTEKLQRFWRATARRSAPPRARDLHPLGMNLGAWLNGQLHGAGRGHRLEDVD
jgi:PRTRC genetic system protein B